MQVYSRASTFEDRISFYQTLPFLSSIIIVWNNVNVAPPSHPDMWIRTGNYTTMSRGYAVPVHIYRQTINSMNNRFGIFAELQSCVVAMDDDWDFSHAKLVRAVRAWQRGGFARGLVGFKQQGRVHVRRDAGTKRITDLNVSGVKEDATIANTPVEFKWGYGKMVRRDISILMPSATVYHARFHHMYTHGLPEKARILVDELTNCDDILFNMMIANATNQGPIVLDDGNKLEKALVFEGEGKGLWRDAEHWRKRAYCMNYFVQNIFGKMPLKLTKVFEEKPRKGRSLK
ncbi:Exostoses (Multiple)-like 3 [Entophlyctis luteolus]|nr:Exostoses (Multiple)-like 3 [Entophlyctis luteolus]